MHAGQDKNAGSADEYRVVTDSLPITTECVPSRYRFDTESVQCFDQGIQAAQTVSEVY